MLKMKRKLQTCDSEDMDIEEGSTFMIFAWNKEDPSNGDNNWQYHGPNRVTKTALLLDYKETDISQQANSLPPDVQTFQITPSNVRNIFLIYINRIHLQIRIFSQPEIPEVDTYYYCEVFKLPSPETDLHLIQFEVLVNQTNKDIVHHYDVYQCNDDYDYPLKVAQNCYVDMPEYVSKSCSGKQFIAWSIGGQYVSFFLF